MQIFSNYQNLRFVDQVRIGQGQRDVFRKATNQSASTIDMRQKLSNAADDSALRIDESVYAFSNLVNNFFTQMGGFAGFSDGIENGFTKFEQIHADIMSSFKGEERDKHLAALAQAFEGVSSAHAVRFAFFIQTTSPDFKSGNAPLTDEEFEVHQRSVAIFEEAKQHMNEMFRSALNFFRANSSFAGFMDTSAANRPGMLSIQDIDIISKGLFDESHQQ